MTAEVGVMNRLGVALAADSAVTIGHDAGKIYTSAEKLFQLSESAPVGVMVNGDATFLGLPWEAAIKTFRAKLRGKRFDRLEEYASEFFQCLKSDRTVFPAKRQNEHSLHLVYALLVNIRSELQHRMTSEAELRDGLDAEDLPPIILDVVRLKIERIRKRPALDGFPADIQGKLRKRFSRQITKAKKSVFGELLKLSPAASRTLTAAAVEMLHRYYFGPAESGIVVAGFGEKDYMPKLVAFSVEGMVLNQPRVYQTESHATEDEGAAIIPFAQQEMVHTFLSGLDPNLGQVVQVSTQKLFRGVVDNIISAVNEWEPELAKALTATVKENSEKLLTSLFDEWSAWRREYWQPVLSIVSALPKDELAAMSEALVNLTKFRRRISAERETVGGPIDVAVITKGDGFVWVKRKHYFPQDRNPRWMAQHARGNP